MANIIVIALALALDAAGVSLGLGCSSDLNKREKGFIIIFFGFFQFLFLLLGSLLGNYIDNNIFKISNYLSGIVILFLGLLLLKEGYENQESDYKELSLWTYVILGISVSIDALGVGFSVLYNMTMIEIINSSVVVGLIASLLTFVSISVVEYIKDIELVEKYADYFGGVILVIFGLKMLI